MDLYGELLEIGGGKERMTMYFNVRWVCTAVSWGWEAACPRGWGSLL